MTLEIYLTYLLAVIAFFATPPDTSQLLIVSNSINHGLKRSIYTIAGDLSANALQMAAAAIGLAAVISRMPNAFSWIKWAGVAYLIYIGIQVFRSGAANFDGSKSEVNTSSIALFQQGFLTSLSNPYAIIFFAALFPQFIVPESSVYLQVTILGVTYLIFDGVILVFWGAIGLKLANHFTGGSSQMIARLCGVIMITAAGLLATKNF